MQRVDLAALISSRFGSELDYHTVKFGAKLTAKVREVLQTVPDKTEGTRFPVCVCLYADSWVGKEKYEQFSEFVEKLKRATSVNILGLVVADSDCIISFNVFPLFKIPVCQGKLLDTITAFVNTSNKSNVPEGNDRESICTDDAIVFTKQTGTVAVSYTKGPDRHPSNNDSCLGGSLITNVALGLSSQSSMEDRVLLRDHCDHNEDLYLNRDSGCCQPEIDYCPLVQNSDCVHQCSHSDVERRHINGGPYYLNENSTSDSPEHRQDQGKYKPFSNSNGCSFAGFDPNGWSSNNQDTTMLYCDSESHCNSFLAPTPSMLSLNLEQCENPNCPHTLHGNPGRHQRPVERSMEDIMDELTKLNQRNGCLRKGEVVSVCEGRA